MRLILIGLVALMFVGCKAKFEGNNGDSVKLTDQQKRELKGEKGPRGLVGPPGPSGAPGIEGAPGSDGEDAAKPQVYLIPTQGKCVMLDSGIYVKNEGTKADFYKSSDCSHGVDNASVYCDNVTDGEIGANDRESCTVIFSNRSLFRYSIVGRGLDMCAVEYKFIDLPEFKEL